MMYQITVVQCPVFINGHEKLCPFYLEKTKVFWGWVRSVLQGSAGVCVLCKHR